MPQILASFVKIYYKISQNITGFAAEKERQKGMKDTTAAKMQKKFIEEYSKTLDIEASLEAARYSKRTGGAIARAMFKNPKVIKELKALCEWKTEHLEVCLGYIIDGYLKVAKWALSADEEGKLNDPALALRALEGITKQLGGGFAQSGCDTRQLSPEIPIITEIIGLDTTKI